MQYLKHYWIDKDGNYCCHQNKVEQRHPELEFPGLDVKIWMHDEDGIDVCLSQVPAGINIVDIVSENNKKVIQKLTEEEFNSVQNPLTEIASLNSQINEDTDEETKNNLELQIQAKYQESQQALFNL
jgi:hypothetical protein